MVKVNWTPCNYCMVCTIYKNGQTQQAEIYLLLHLQRRISSWEIRQSRRADIDSMVACCLLYLRDFLTTRVCVSAYTTGLWRMHQVVPLRIRLHLLLVYSLNNQGSDIYLLSVIHRWFLFPHFQWCQLGNPEVGFTPSF